MLKEKSKEGAKESLFGTDGIRALAGEYPLTAEGVRKIGFAAGKIFQGKSGAKPSWIIGRDTRESGNWIERALTEGLREGGCDVFSCGVIPTSAVSVIMREKNFSGGAAVSASHNPPEFNGIKFFSRGGLKFSGSFEAEIEKNVAEEGHSALPGEEADMIENFPEAQLMYARFLKKNLPDDFSLRGMKLVVDCANGSASCIAPELLGSLGADIIAIHNGPNGKNINLKCGATHPGSMQKEVLKSGAFGGVTFDGDADRVFFADEKGSLMDGDALLGVAAAHLKEQNKLPNNCVVATVMANLGLLNGLKKLDIKTVVTSVGDRSVAEGMAANGAVLGGEQSGHIIFGGLLPTGDGLLTALQILNIVAGKKQKLSYFNGLFPKYPQVLLNVKVGKKTPVRELPEFQSLIKASEARLGENGRILVRYSGTEPLLRIMVEGRYDALIKEIAGTLADAAKKELA